MKYEINGFYNCDCMDLLKSLPDKYIGLAIVDPPYGIGCMTMNYTKSGRIYTRAAKRTDFRKQCNWDIKPDKKYFEELFRVSKRQIIWGGNYFSDMLPPSKSFIVWDKRVYENMTNDFADCEYAWCSNEMGVSRMFRFCWNGMIQGNMKNKEKRFHPTQKPIALYEWILNKYGKKGEIILDTHVGSASSLIACYRLGFDYLGCELDKEYFDKAMERLEKEKEQLRIEI